MNIQFTGTNIDVTDALKEHAHKRIDRHLKHFDYIQSIDIDFRVEHNTQAATGKIIFDGGSVVASADSPDMYATIDALIDKLDKQLIKHKTRHKDRH